MSCEVVREKLDKLADHLPERSTDEFHAVQASIYLRKSCPDTPRSHTAALATDISLECTPYRRSHTSSILASLSGQDPKIPNYLRKHPEKQQVLIENGIIDEVLV